VIIEAKDDGGDSDNWTTGAELYNLNCTMARSTTFEMRPFRTYDSSTE